MQIECCVGEVLMKDTLRFPLSVRDWTAHYVIFSSSKLASVLTLNFLTKLYFQTGCINCRQWSPLNIAWLSVRVCKQSGLIDSRLTIELTRGRTAKAYRLDDLTKEDEGLFYCHKPDDTVCNKDRVQLIIRQKRVDWQNKSKRSLPVQYITIKWS